VNPEEKNSVWYEREIICEGYEFTYRCPRTFDSLEWMIDPESRTFGGKVGFCNECNRKVYMCETSAEVADHASRGNCVAISRASEKPLYQIGGIGVVEMAPPTNDATIKLQKDVFQRIDKALIQNLRAEGFVGSHSDLRKQHQGYQEVISIKLDVTRNSKFKIDYSYLFSDLLKLEFHESFFVHSEDYLVSNERASSGEEISLDATIDKMVADVAAARGRLNSIWQGLVSRLETAPDELLSRPVCQDNDIDQKITDRQLAWVFRIRGDDARADCLAFRALREFFNREPYKRLLRYHKRGSLTDRDVVIKISEYLKYDLFTCMHNGRIWLLPPHDVFSAMPQFVQERLADGGWLGNERVRMFWAAALSNLSTMVKNESESKKS